MDPTTDTVVIDDDLAQGFAKLEQALAGKPARVSAPVTEPARGPAFEFRGGPRYTPILLAIVLPFAWLAVLYFALANLLAETTLDRDTGKDNQARIEALERELQALRSEVIAAPRTPKSKASRPKGESKPSRDPSEESKAPADSKAPAEPAAPDPSADPG